MWIDKSTAVVDAMKTQQQWKDIEEQICFGSPPEAMLLLV